MKKATMIFSKIIMVIISIVAIIILGMLLSKIGNISEKTTYEAGCKASIATFSKLSKAQKFTTLGSAPGESDAESVNCPTQYITFKKRTSKTEQTQEIANLMAQCFNIYGAGKVSLVGVNNKLFCGICSVIEFEKKDQVLEIPYYLMTHKAPYKKDSGYPTYYEYITGSKPSASLLEKFKSSPVGKLEGSKRYVIIYEYMKFNGVDIVLNNMNKYPFSLALGAVAAYSSSGELVKTAQKKDAIGTGDGTILLMEYSADGLSKLGCHSVPFSQLEKKYR